MQVILHRDAVPSSEMGHGRVVYKNGQLKKHVNNQQ